MKESVLDVLMYLFEHCLGQDDVDVESDRESLRQELVDAGFQDAKISKALAWLEGLSGNQDKPGQEGNERASALRLYSRDEMERMDSECRGFLLSLEQVGIVDATTRELIIDRVMELETQGLDLEQLKWVTLMVLFNQPGKESMFASMEGFVLNRESECLH